MSIHHWSNPDSLSHGLKMINHSTHGQFWEASELPFHYFCEMCIHLWQKKSSFTRSFISNMFSSVCASEQFARRYYDNRCSLHVWVNNITWYLQNSNGIKYSPKHCKMYNCLLPFMLICSNYVQTPSGPKDKNAQQAPIRCWSPYSEILCSLTMTFSKATEMISWIFKCFST